jgi:hypothetical protein
MPASLTDTLHEWHDFYMLVGTASATLVGLMFVSASIGANFYNESHVKALRAFVTPTVVHFSSALFVCVLFIVPIHDWAWLSGLLGIGALVGVVYSGLILVRTLIRPDFTLDLADRLFYAVLPGLGYGLLVAAAVLMFMHSAVSPDLVAVALGILLLVGVRNAWDMTIFIVLRAPTTR